MFKFKVTVVFLPILLKVGIVFSKHVAIDFNKLQIGTRGGVVAPPYLFPKALSLSLH